MDTEDMTFVEECEQLMYEVIESRKRFGKICKDYEQKASLIENKMLQMQLDIINNQRLKPRKTALPDNNKNNKVVETTQFLAKVSERSRAQATFFCDVKNINNVLEKVKVCPATKKCAKPLTVEDILANAHNTQTTTN